MKKLFVTFALLFATFTSFSQSVYYDAIYIEKNTTFLADGGMELNVTDSVLTILKKHYPFIAQDISEQRLTDSLKKNPFFNKITVLGLTRDSGIEPKFLEMKSLVEGAGNLNVTNFADGLAKFLVARVKDELSISFFEDFKVNILKHEELKYQFPQTYQLLQYIDRDIYNYQVYLPALRVAFEKDLRNVLENSKNLLANTKFPAGITSEQKVLAITVLNVGSMLQNNQHIGVIIDKIGKDESLKKTDTDWAKAIRFSQALSNSLRSDTGNNHWISKKELNKLNDANTIRIYLGLLYQTIPDSSTRVKLSEVASTKIFNHLKDFIEIAQTVGSITDELKKKNNEASYQEVLNYFKLAKQVIDQAEVWGVVKINNQACFSEAFDLTNNIVADVIKKNYSSAIMNSTILITKVGIDKCNAIDSEKLDVSRNIVKYGTFMAAVVGAENSDQVKSAIETVALPPGSSRVKKESKTNISLNAYVGPSLGGEVMFALNKHNNKAAFGLSAPVGIAFNWGVSPYTKGKGYKSFSLFISAIDIGALTTFRFADDQTEVLPEIQLKNILSPGAFAIWGFGKYPLSVSAGVQLGPQLRNISTTNPDIVVETSKNVYLKYSLSLLVDIPLLNFSTKTR